MSVKLKNANYAAAYLRKFIASNRYRNCIAHHTIQVIPETKLKDKVYMCQRVTAQTVKIQDLLGEMYEAGILDHLLAPQNSEINYRLTPAARRAYKKIFISNKTPIKHPAISKNEELILIAS